ncbi:hypothetical protein K469DRAFT_376337 [Zopfia rhizophila CBS 207.26]|uniref:Ribosome assembly protein 3 n=1 Tax=Zopfia rhizophila CBS 207.26 TaxID=1314779 RepID=A0A6A6DG13_9PEZI|nr:hypothetical protein K469DRAFT_376337 [Zopfia rhizophila CBS 207.26]
MAKSTPSNSTQKPKRSRKRKARTDVASSSESESEKSDVGKRKKSETDKDELAQDAGAIKASKKVKKEKKKSKSNANSETPEVNGDVSMAVPEEGQSPAPPCQDEDFTSLYLRKVTAELADDLDKVREANDFTNRSMPMLIHALRQGESIFGVEEKRRIVSAS